MKNYIKVLSNDDFNNKNKRWQNLILKQLEKYSVEITPKFYRNGWYYNRLENISWKELNGRAWLDDKCNIFKYNLELQNHRPLLQKERNSIIILRKNKLASKKLKHLLYIDNCVLELKTLRQTTKKHMRSMLRK